MPNKFKNVKYFDDEVRDLILRECIGSQGASVSWLLSLYYKLKHVKVDNTIKTIAAEPHEPYLIYNPEFVNKHKSNLLGLLSHELLHIVLLNTSFPSNLIDIKDGTLDHELINISQDLTINHFIKWGLHYELPKNGLIPNYDGTYTLKINDRRIKIEGININKSWIDIYLLLKNELSSGGGSCNGEGKGKDEDVVVINNNGVYVNGEKIECDIKTLPKSDKLNDVNNRCQDIRNGTLGMVGNMHCEGVIKDFIRLNVNIKKDWRQVLSRKLRYIINGNLYRKNRKKFKKNKYVNNIISYPLTKKGIEAVCVVDVSGSMDMNTITKSINILHDIMKSVGGTLLLSSYDTDKVDERLIRKRISRVEDLNIAISSGGTNIRNMLKYINDSKKDIKILITDMVDNVKDDEYKDLDILITNNSNYKYPNGVIIE